VAKIIVKQLLWPKPLRDVADFIFFLSHKAQRLTDIYSNTTKDKLCDAVKEFRKEKPHKSMYYIEDGIDALEDFRLTTFLKILGLPLFRIEFDVTLPKFLKPILINESNAAKLGQLLMAINGNFNEQIDNAIQNHSGDKDAFAQDIYNLLKVKKASLYTTLVTEVAYYGVCKCSTGDTGLTSDECAARHGTCSKN